MATHAKRDNAAQVRVALYAGKGTHADPVAARLAKWGFDVQRIEGPAELAGLSGDAVEVVYLPGGWYGFKPDVASALVEFVRAGGGCVGSCAGAYQVAGHIPVIAGRVLRSNMRGRLYLEPQRGDHPILAGAVRECTRHDQRKWEPIAVTHLGGPVILPDDPSTIIASYDVEGELGAIVAAEVGSGRAVALASHPELPLADLPADDTADPDVSAFQGDESLIVRNAVLWAARSPTAGG